MHKLSNDRLLNLIIIKSPGPEALLRNFESGYVATIVVGLLRHWNGTLHIEVFFHTVPRYSVQ